MYLGRYDGLDEAIKARVDASNKCFGEIQNKREKKITLHLNAKSDMKLKVNININK